MNAAPQYETITMPDAGIGSFLTSNMDEIDDNVLMFGHGGGINSMHEVADRMAKMGREGDTFVVHASEKEVMVPREVAENNPQLLAQIKDAIAAEGADPEAYIVGSDRNSINPMTGQREFFLKKLVGGIKKVFKKAAKVIIPVALNYFFPGMGAIASGAIGAGIGGLIQGESFGDALKSAALGGLTAGVMSGVSGALGSIGDPNQTLGQGFMSGLKGALPSQDVSFFTNRFDMKDAPGFLDPLGTGRAGDAGFEPFMSQAAPEITKLSQLSPSQLEYATRLDGISPGLSEKALVDAAVNAVPSTTAGAAGSGSFLKTAAQVGIPALLTTAALGGLDPEPASPIDLTDLGINVGGDGTGDLSTNPLASSTDVYEQNPERYSVGQPGQTNFISPIQAIYSGQPLTTAAYLPSQGTYNPIVPSATYANLTATGAGTAPITPSGASSSPEVAEVQLAGYDPRFTGMRPAPIYGIDALGNPVMTPYIEPIMPARFVGSNQEVQMAAAGGAMNFPRRTGQIEGPGTETSDDIPAMLSDGEFVMTAKAVKGAGNGSREQGFRKMYDIMRSFEGGAVA